jgi:uncharacterized SAM-binding protein YcdF (DUF218 family)
MYDAILIPGGGVQADGTPPPWVRERLDLAAAMRGNAFLLTMSAGTVHKPPPLSSDGFPVYESVASARYLMKKGVPSDFILYETCSWDTIGNAYFSRVIHVNPACFQRLLVITSEFHLPRTKAIFEFVYGLSPSLSKVEFAGVPDVGVDPEALAERREKERRGLDSFRKLSASLNSLTELHAWLYSRHDAYRPAAMGTRGESDIGAASRTY